jgi:hypothetical protein
MDAATPHWLCRYSHICHTTNLGGDLLIPYRNEMTSIRHFRSYDWFRSLLETQPVSWHKTEVPGTG